MIKLNTSKLFREKDFSGEAIDLAIELVERVDDLEELFTNKLLDNLQDEMLNDVTMDEYDNMWLVLSMYYNPNELNSNSLGIAQVQFICDIVECLYKV